MYRQLYFTVLALAAITLYGVKGQDPNCVRSATFGAERVHLVWSPNFETETIEFTITAQTTGFVGFGLSNYSGMSDADITIGGVYENGTTYFGDYRGIGTVRPELDENQDWFLDSASENETHTTLRMHRAFDTGDSQDNVITNSSRVTFIWAMGTTDNWNFGHSSSDRGQIPLNILDFPECVDAPTTCTPPNPPTKNETLTEDDSYVVSWIVDMETKTVRFRITVRTTGWFGFGLSEVGGMKMADIAIGGVFENGTVYFGDFFGLGQGPPELDSSQDWIVDAAGQNATHTELILSRPFDTLDILDVPINEEPINVIWAIGTTDIVDYHYGNKGAKSLRILDPYECP